ncbi:tRNA pseudouridine(55) synthase TruB [Thermopolyspora sp. NPDC052614]|uniref:tRNA pseudouridine(55) synthase TruB n=1 Tax=Thermopolyspora sp. NPDC052614 TaxID=3155682 RepID=UPI00344555E8
MKPPPPESGLIIVDKPSGWTSHDVVGKLRRLAGTRRVGHAGTLDPMATGVLVIGVEKATRLLGHLALTEKVYEATIRLGVTTDTDDAEGRVLAVTAADGVSREAVEAGVAALTGRIMQIPPQVSAIKVDGKRAYKRARAGEDVELSARPVTVYAFEVTALRPAEHAEPPAEHENLDDGARSAPEAHPGGEPSGRADDAAHAAVAVGGGSAGRPVLDVDVTVRCSSGTYIRSLARDLGERLGVGGHLTYLRRTRVGPYDVSSARTIEQLADKCEILPMAQAVAAAFPRRDVSAEQARVVAHGGRLPAAGLGDGPIGVFGPDGTLLALVEEKGGQARALAVFAP